MEVLGFQVQFQREKYAYMRLGQVEFMIAQANRHWGTGSYVRPLGRGINFQIFVADPGLLFYIAGYMHS